jgi:hypothetical protein
MNERDFVAWNFNCLWNSARSKSSLSRTALSLYLCFLIPPPCKIFFNTFCLVFLFFMNRFSRIDALIDESISFFVFAFFFFYCGCRLRFALWSWWILMNPRPRDEEWWTRFWGGVRRRNTKLNKTQSDLTWCNPISPIPLFNFLLLLLLLLW